MENSDPFLKTQIITYMGNKRKLLSAIDDVVVQIKTDLKMDHLTIGDGFSGSGIVSRLMKKHASTLYTNDIAGYSETLNKCYLASPNKTKLREIQKYIDTANESIINVTEPSPAWISKHWAPKSDTVLSGERAYYTSDNSKRIDIIRNYIETIPKSYQHFLLAPLLVESSIHNNTNGQFAAYFKGGNNIGAFGGKGKVDIKRITKPIQLNMPIFHSNSCNVKISKLGTNDWVKTLPHVDLVYYDPPYNKHPYNIYYFLLDIINNWDMTNPIPDTYRGQPKNWVKSDYNSLKYAETAMNNLIKMTNSTYILLSYNNGGIIPLETIDSILETYGEVYRIPVVHKTYNKLKGLSNYKRKTDYKNVKEFLWLLKKQ